MNKSDKHQQASYLVEAVNHLKQEIDQHEHITGAFRGLVYSVVETLGQLVGDPDLPEHLKSGVEGALEIAREIENKISN